MKKQTNYTANSQILRQKAEELLKKNKTKKVSKLTEIETLRLIHELEVHQIELEMQYDELEQAKARAAELASEKYAELYDLAPSGYFTLSKEGEILDLNLCGSQMLGKERSHLKSGLFGFFVSDDTRSTFNLFLKNLFQNKAKESCDVTLANDTSLMHIHLTGIIEKGDQCLITAVDITNRRQAEDDLRQSEKRLRTITENAPNIILEVDRSGSIVFISKVLPGYQMEDVLGRNFCDWTPPEYHAEMMQTLNRVFSEGKPQSFQIRGLGEKGEMRWYLTSLSPVKVGGLVENAIVIATDINDQILAKEQHTAILQTTLDGFWRVDMHGNLLEVNESYCKMSGYSLKELLSMRISDLEEDENESDVSNHIKKVIEQGEDRFETRHRRKDGSLFDVEISTQYQPSEKHFVSFIRDITERKLAEENLRQSEDRYKSLFQGNHSVMLLIDPGTGEIKDANPAACKFYGWTHSEITNKNISEINTLSKESIAVNLQNSKTNKENHLFFQHRLANGKLRHVEVYSGPISFGESTLLYSIIHDITETKHAQEALKERELIFRKYVDHAPHGIFVANEKGQYTDVNIAASLITGYSKEELLSINLIQLIHEESMEGARQHFNRVTTEGFATGEFAFVKKDGVKGFWSVDAVKLSDNVFLGFVVDITRRKQTEEALAKNERLLRESQAAAHIGSYSADLISKTWTASPEMYKIFGIDETHPHTMEEWIKSLHPDFREELVNEVFQIKDRKESSDREYKIIRICDNVERWVHGIGEFEYDNQMNPIRLIGTIQDITKRKRTEESLIESEQRYHSLFEESNDALFLVDLISGHYMDCNRLAETLTGYTRQEILHMKTGAFLPLTRKEEIISNMKAIMSGKVLRSETEIISKGGNLIPVEFNSSLVTINKRQCILSMLHDISDRRAAEEALRQSEERVRVKLQSILSPEGSIADLELSDIIDAQSIQKLMDNFYELAQIPMAIIDKNGTFLVGVGWQNICTKFHRVNPESCRNCIESDIQLTQGIPDGEFKLYKCKNNLWDIATPLIIGGEHKGNLFMGQFFFEGEPIDYKLFHEQALRYGFEEQAYMEELESVPRISERKLDHAKAFFLNLSKTISQLSYGNIKLARAIVQQKKVEEALRESGESLKKAQEIAHVGSWSLDLDKNLLIWNDEMYRIFGIQPQKFPATYEGFLDSVHPEDRNAVNTSYTTSVLEGKDSYEIIHRIYRKHSGELRHILEKCEHVRDASGKIIRSVGMSHDITEQKQAAEALKQLNEELEERIKERTSELLTSNKTLKLTEEKYRTVADFTTNWEFWISPDDQMIYCSPSCERITGYSVADFVENPQLLFDIVHPEDLPMYLEHKKQEMQAQACVHEIKFRIFRKDGSIRWIGHFCQPVFDESGHFKGIRGSNKDIHARKKGEELLKKSNLKYSLLSANITDGIFIFRNNCFEYVNRAMSHIFGYQGTELIGLGLNHLVLPENANELNFMQSDPPLNQKRSVEIECVKKDQSIITVEFLFNYIALEKVIYGVAHDITEKKQVQKNIVKAIILTEEKERTYFSKELHDGLGPLLSTIKLYLEWSKEAKNRQSRVEIVSKAEEIIEDSIRTVKEISNKLSPHILINFGLFSAIKSFVDKLQNTSSIKIELDCKIPKRLDNEIEAAIYRATIECINNTIKYSGAKNIKISLYDTGNQLQLRYLDDGVGFDINETIAMKKGLGLFNLQNRIQNIGGTIVMLSQPGKGVDYQIVVNI